MAEGFIALFHLFSANVWNEYCHSYPCERKSELDAYSGFSKVIQWVVESRF